MPVTPAQARKQLMNPVKRLLAILPKRTYPETPPPRTLLAKTEPSEELSSMRPLSLNPVSPPAARAATTTPDAWLPLIVP